VDKLAESDKSASATRDFPNCSVTELWPERCESGESVHHQPRPAPPPTSVAATRGCVARPCTTAAATPAQGQALGRDPGGGVEIRDHGRRDADIGAELGAAAKKQRAENREEREGGGARDPREAGVLGRSDAAAGNDQGSREPRGSGRSSCAMASAKRSRRCSGLRPGSKSAVS